MENYIRSPSGSSDTTLFAMRSRKRASSSIDVLRSESMFHLSSMKESRSFAGGNGQGNDIPLNQTISLGPETLRHQFQSDQFHQHNDFEESRFTSGTLSTMPQSSKFREPSPRLKMPAGELPEHNFTALKCEIGGQMEPQRSLTMQRIHSNNAEKSQLRPNPEDQMRSMDMNQISPDLFPVGVCNVSTEFMRAEGILPQSSLPYGSCDIRTRACSNGFNDFKNSFQPRQCGQFPNNLETIKFPYDRLDSSGASSYAEQMEKKSSLQGNIQGTGSSLITPLDGNSESKGPHGVSDFKQNESKEASKELEASMTDKDLSKEDNEVGNGVEHGHPNKLNQDFGKLNGKSMPPSKTTSTAAEKLWEGSLQMNTSTTASAVAFFKSGEKLLDINWSEIVEVKGKVKLEAFEQYIQDLPRSRTRGMMVISICWKQGSSKSGLKAMQEVAKGYHRGERVGLAQLSPGAHIYLCPRSNTIITILARHGFFSGKAAVEVKSELLIGCVVWKRNIVTSSTVKNSENKSKSMQEQLPKSPSDTTSKQEAGGKSSSSVPPDQNSKSSIFEDVSVVESKNLLSNPSMENVSISVGQQNSSYPTFPFDSSKGELLEIGRASEAGFPKASLQLPKGIISVPSNVMKERFCRADIDDLPEFDFRNTNEKSLTSDASAFNIKLHHEENKNRDFMMLPMMSAKYSVSVSDTRSSHTSVHHQKPILVQHKNERNHSLQTISPDPVAVVANKFAPTRTPFDKFGKKNLFDDDEDIPEWIPPDREKPNSTEAIEPSHSIPSVFSNSSSQWLSMGVASSFPFPAVSLPERPFHRPPPSVKILPPTPSEHGSSSLTGFTFTPLLRPPSSLPPLPGKRWGTRP